MLKSRKMTELSTAAQKVVLAELAPLADRAWALFNMMRNAGWDVFVPRTEFEQSFGDESDIEEYRRVAVELAKIRLLGPFPNLLGVPYISPLLEALRKRWAEENMKRFGTSNTLEIPVWAREVATCLRRMELLRYAQKGEFQLRFHEVELEEERLRTHEIARHATGLSGKCAGELERPARFYKAVVERETGRMGFAFDSGRSSQNYLVFSKTLIPGWDLCAASEPLEWFPGKKEGRAPLLLSVQSSSNKRPIKKAAWSRFMVIDYAVVIKHFYVCYLRFRSLDELEIIIMAQTYLLSLVIEEIEDRLREGFAKVL